MEARLAAIRLFPIKALDGLRVESAVLRPGGGLAHDREWCFVDAEGLPVNGKRVVLVHAVRAEYELERLRVRLRREDEPEWAEFSLEDDQADLESWMSAHIGIGVRLVRDAELGFPDDPERPGPTLVSSASLAEVSRWFEWEGEEAALRFRANLEIDGVGPFWEDRLVGADGAPVRFHVGAAVLEGRNLCARCVVPSRHPRTGVAIHRFHHQFAEKREAALPSIPGREAFDGFYRLAVNTSAPVPQGGQGEVVVRVGDPVRIA